MIFYRANDHQFGPGKSHLVDDADPLKLYCGRWIRDVPGSLEPAGPTRALCQNCVQAVERREQHRVEQQRQREFAEQRRAERARQDAEWHARYAEYLESPEWAERRERVMRRAGWICEGCGARRATEVHHLTYEHVRKEFLWELRAVCRDCHERFHDVDDDD
jgi:5-methylcytosine-specific restriction endonuclease McrA